MRGADPKGNQKLRDDQTSFLGSDQGLFLVLAASKKVGKGGL